MEAEAQCAELVHLGLVEGIITDDSDVFLFGGNRVFRNMFNQSKTVECFLSSDLVRELGLDRGTLVRLAYLLGSDYTDGLTGVGPVVAMELVKEFPGDDGLERFAEWWRKVQSGRDKKDEGASKFRKSFVSAPPSSLSFVILAFLSGARHLTNNRCVGFGSPGPETTEIYSVLVLLPREFFWGWTPPNTQFPRGPRWILIGRSYRALLSIVIPVSRPLSFPLVFCPLDSVWHSESYRFGRTRVLWNARKRSSRRCTLGRIGRTLQWYVDSRNPCPPPGCTISHIRPLHLSKLYRSIVPNPA